MNAETEPTVVESWNEWDPLKHVIVGKADGCCIPPPEPALDAKVPEDSDMRGQFGPRPQETVDRANELLDNFADLLKKRGVRVDRPVPLDFNQPSATPDWETETMFGCMPPRDVLLTVGKEILEATMSYRCRWFEYLCYRPLLQQYYNDDPGMRHEAAPKPRLTDADYRPDYLSEKIGVEKRLQWTADKFFVTTEEELLFDAADVLRFGKDLVVQHGFTTNLKGIDWLRRHYPDHQVHTVNFPGDPIPHPHRCDLHADPARPDPEQSGTPPARRPAQDVRAQRLGDRGRRQARAQFTAAALLFLDVAVDECARTGPQDRLRRGVRGAPDGATRQAGSERDPGRPARRLRLRRRPALLHR